MSPMMTTSRRAFLGTAGMLILKPDLVRGSQNNSAVRMALFGCGGRGTGVAESFTEHTQAQYVALGDLFQAQTEKAKQTLDKASLKAGKPEIESSKLFYGPDSLDKLCASKDIDAIHIATPPYFHPEHFAKAAASGKHIYLEKPVAIDVPGARSVIATGQKVGTKASVAVGFQLRHATPYVQLKERILNGQLGDVACGLSHYYATAALEHPEWDNASPNERRLRNWIHDKVLSGDILVEQNIHLIDFNNWILGAHPVKVSGTCGRKGRKDHGDCSSHFNVTYTYPGDIDVTVTSTQFGEGGWDVAMRFFGTKGSSMSKYDAPVSITGLEPWEYPGLGKPVQVSDVNAAAGAFTGALDDADTMKEQHFISSITSGKFINEASQGAESTLSAILGRYAAYTGRSWKWEELTTVKEVWDAHLNVAKL